MASYINLKPFLAKAIVEFILERHSELVHDAAKDADVCDEELVKFVLHEVFFRSMYELREQGDFGSDVVQAIEYEKMMFADDELGSMVYRIAGLRISDLCSLDMEFATA